LYIQYCPHNLLLQEIMLEAELAVRAREEALNQELFRLR
jgi:hypothetical protein